MKKSIQKLLLFCSASILFQSQTYAEEPSLESKNLFFKFGFGAVMLSEFGDPNFENKSTIYLGDLSPELGFSASLGLGREFRQDSFLSFSAAIQVFYSSSDQSNITGDHLIAQEPSTQTSLPSNDPASLESFKSKQIQLDATAEISAHLNYNLENLIIGPTFSLEAGWGQRIDEHEYTLKDQTNPNHDKSSKSSMIPMKIGIGIRLINDDGFFSFLKAKYSVYQQLSQETTVTTYTPNEKNDETTDLSYDQTQNIQVILGGGIYF